MAQENPTRDQTIILILGTVRSEKQDFFSKLNSFSFLMVQDKDGIPSSIFPRGLHSLRLPFSLW